MIINGNTYEMPEVTYNAICILSKNGYDIMNSSKEISYMEQIRIIIAWAINTTPDLAGAMIDTHVNEGGDYQDLATVVFGEFNEAVLNSGFFQQLKKKAEEKAEKEAKATQNKKNSKTIVEAQET